MYVVYEVYMWCSILIVYKSDVTLCCVLYIYYRRVTTVAANKVHKKYTIVIDFVHYR